MKESYLATKTRSGMEAGRIDIAQLRDDWIPMPEQNEGYTRVLLVGTTGAGKTTLLRHMIGSSHEHDRFPSTSTAKTTISDTEIVMADGPFRAAVTFMSELEVRAHIDECIEAACLEAIKGKPDAKIAAALLTHREQRFRLSYLIGEWGIDEPADDDDFSFDSATPTASGNPDDEDSVTDDAWQANSKRIESYVSRVRDLATEIDTQNATDLGLLSAQHTSDDKAAWLELYIDSLFGSEEFTKLALDIQDEIESRFDLLDAGTLERSATGWPVIWTFENADREAFLRQVRWFSSNHFR